MQFVPARDFRVNPPSVWNTPEQDQWLTLLTRMQVHIADSGAGNMPLDQINAEIAAARAQN